MITSRATRLVRVPDYKGLRAAVAQLCPPLSLAVRRTAILVPTRGAADALRRSLETAAFERGAEAVLLPDILTRSEFYAALHLARPDAPRILRPQEREVLLRRAARETIASGVLPPFRLRAGLVLQMLDFYDELRRREATLDDFARHTVPRLSDSADSDRGAERLLRQTEFLLATFAAFERLVAATGALDEHAQRALLTSSGGGGGVYDRVVVTVPDQAADPRGLYTSDFVLLTRLPALAALDIVATEASLAAGFHERLHGLLPELEEVRVTSDAPPPALVVPESAEGDVRWFTARDREEELSGLVRQFKARAASPHEAVRLPRLDRIAIVFQRPLPYLYLARQVFADAGIDWQALDALPLSGEPMAATLDVILSVLSSEGNRTSLAELLRSPHLSLGEGLDDREVAALDTRLLEMKYAGGWERLAALTPEGAAHAAGNAALAAAQAAAVALRPVVESADAAAQFDALLAFLVSHERTPQTDDEPAGRHLRARAAVLGSLHALRDAHAVHDNERLDVVQLAGTIRRWIDGETFQPLVGTSGVRLLDAAAAPFADVDELHVVGLVERDWPDPVRRSIFYPATILADLGWPMDAARMPSARAAFHDLLTSARLRTALWVFTLEEDSLVAPSPLLEEVEAAGLAIDPLPAPPPARVFLHERQLEGRALDDGPAAEWLRLRTARTSPEDPRFAGMTGPRAAEAYAISYLERYLDCPFKYFANRVLRLPEEREEEAGLTPIERGHLLHGVFEAFFREWDAEGRGTITTANVADALERFARIAEARIQELPDADRALERTHLLGSAAASGLAERAFAFEIEQGGQVVERLLEHELEGEFTFLGSQGSRQVRIKGKADRLDLMADGTIRVIDYKLGKAPKAGRSLQLPIYGVIAQQALDGYRGRSWRVGAAGYVAFREKEPFVPLGGRGSLEAAIAEGQQRLLDAVDGIERGEFPVKPDEPFRCRWCAYAGVCRKDYVGDE